MSDSPSKRHWRMSVFLWIGLPVIALIGLAKAAPDLVPAWKAQSGSGVTGTFTAARESCSHGSCDFYGDWRAADGTSTRTDVLLYDGPDSLRIGATAEARDAGAAGGVFSTEGGSSYLLVTAFAVGGLAAAIAWPVFLWRTWRTWRSSRGHAAASSPEPAEAAV
ncbi:hypothetical protein ACFRMQ_05070 [Kitasatospora sp. NPDC056783]|uniref:hypothetical protein n=1 Tax=Kitasatospora sp. NPDC056783 TaxID=3345943 RepID=UPI003690174B